MVALVSAAGTSVLSVSAMCVAGSSTWASCGLRCCKNKAYFVSWLEVVKCLPNQGVDCFVN